MRRRAGRSPPPQLASSGPVATNPPPWRSKCARRRPPRRIPSRISRQAHLVEITARAQRVQAHPVADLACEAQHRRPDRGDRHRHRCQPGRFRREIRGHQAELVMLALIVEPLAGFPAPPHRAQRADVVAQPRRGRAPWNTKASLVVAFDLAAEAENEPPVGIRVKIPGLARHNRRAAWKGDGDRRRQLDPAGGERGEGERRERLVAELDGRHRVEAGCLPPRRRMVRLRANRRIGRVAKTRISAPARMIAFAAARCPRHHQNQKQREPQGPLPPFLPNAVGGAERQQSRSRDCRRLAAANRRGHSAAGEREPGASGQQREQHRTRHAELEPELKRSIVRMERQPGLARLRSGPSRRGLHATNSSPQPASGCSAIRSPTKDQISSRCPAENLTASAVATRSDTRSSRAKVSGAVMMTRTETSAAARAARAPPIVTQKRHWQPGGERHLCRRPGEHAHRRDGNSREQQAARLAPAFDDQPRPSAAAISPM